MNTKIEFKGLFDVVWISNNMWWFDITHMFERLSVVASIQKLAPELLSFYIYWMLRSTYLLAPESIPNCLRTSVKYHQTSHIRQKWYALFNGCTEVSHISIWFEKFICDLKHLFRNFCHPNWTVDFWSLQSKLNPTVPKCLKPECCFFFLYREL